MQVYLAPGVLHSMSPGRVACRWKHLIISRVMLCGLTVLLLDGGMLVEYKMSWSLSLSLSMAAYFALLLVWICFPFIYGITVLPVICHFLTWLCRKSAVTFLRLSNCFHTSMTLGGILIWAAKKRILGDGKCSEVSWSDLLEWSCGYSATC